MFAKPSHRLAVLCAIPVAIALLCVFGPFLTDSIYLYSGLATDLRGGLIRGRPTIDPNVGSTAYSLGVRGVIEVFSGRLPLWNYYEGFGAPLLGEMQAAPLFPPTWLLAVPNGQALEHTLLQFVAGLGTYLFLRRFGLGVVASLAGALLYEVNGVFAWLRNAIYNPVAFLPWLMFIVEVVRARALSDLALRARIAPICGGALIAALAIYAGFPEQVYLYSLLVLAWTCFRLAGLAGAQLRRFITDLVLTAMLALALIAPALIAFGTYLTEAHLGPHADEGFYGATLSPIALLHYLLPYVYGPIFNSPSAQVMEHWGGVGGYIGFLPLVLGIASLGLPDRRSVKLLLLAWIVIAVGVTQGLPGVYQAFMLLPLTKTAATYRYLNPSWIFCTVFLAALFIDRLPTLTPASVRRVSIASVVCGLVLLLGATGANARVLIEIWNASADGKGGIALSFTLAAALCAGLIFAVCRANLTQAAVLVSSLLIGEALLCFLVPFLSYPRRGQIDTATIAFLRSHAGLQRVMDSAGYGLGFNYGSALGIANVHYNNVPVPAQTAAYIAARLDPAVDPSFAPPAENDLERQALMQERLPAYAHVGVKYVLASPTFHAIPAYSITQARTTVPLLPGSAIETTARNETADVISVAGLTFQVYNRGRNADGHLQASVCVGDDCVQGFADLDIARDERPFLIPLGNVLRVAPGATYTVRLARQGGTGAFALYLYRPETTAAVTATADHGSLPAGFALPLGFIPRMDLLPVHLGTSMAIYELPNPRSYFSAPGCDVTAHDRAHVEVSCAAPATLTRLELMMRGWRASVNGLPAEIGREDETFQTVAVPAGHAVVAFTYAPTGIRTAFVVAAVTLLMVLLVLANATRGGRHAVK